jgi:hypothetical protein
MAEFYYVKNSGINYKFKNNISSFTIVKVDKTF